jgi:LacI family transcriptional regulator
MSGFDAGQNLTRELLKHRRSFTALMAFDDLTAFGAIRALAKAGINVPGQCAVIGFDDVAPSNLFTPSLTTIRQPMQAMGEAAANILLENISAVQDKRKVQAVHRKLVPDLVVRESTTPVT